MRLSERGFLLIVIICLLVAIIIVLAIDRFAPTRNQHLLSDKHRAATINAPLAAPSPGTASGARPPSFLLPPPPPLPPGMFDDSPPK